MKPLIFTVFGKAVGAGSKSIGMTKDKRPFVRPPTGKHGSDPKAWKESVAQVAGEAMNGSGLFVGPLRVSFTFYRPRPSSHFGTGRNAGKLKPSAPAYPTGKPDVLKVARAVEDALTGVVYRDDAQIVFEVLEKRYGEPARVEVTIVPLRPEE